MAFWRTVTVDSTVGRLGRAVVFAVASVCLALAAHFAAGGAVPPLPVLIVATALLARVAFGLNGRERGQLAVVAAVAAVQVVLHITFVLADHPGCTHPGGLAGEGEHLLAALLPGAVMNLAHALAALAVALLLHSGDRRLWQTAALRRAVDRAVAAAAVVLAEVRAGLAALRLLPGLGSAGRIPLGGAAVPGGMPAVGSPATPWQPRLLLLGTDAGRRGPPTGPAGYASVTAVPRFGG